MQLIPNSPGQYHTGYQEQMSRWPEQPVNIIMKWLKDRSFSLVVADFGCGDARLAKGVKNKVFSIDLVSKDPSVIACDMSNFLFKLVRGWKIPLDDRVSSSARATHDSRRWIASVPMMGSMQASSIRIKKASSCTFVGSSVLNLLRLCS
ncbi:hypothetical protein L6452_30893 [Arctium lappa]|uniref:Uncharacterized protein n=1 Tax=Arctium lappa TaxID=4217 RepID=A0ACB8ZKD8_ARCLA|nr:hypothetical protein L6452_30893 [Arctium lappa]